MAPAFQAVGAQVNSTGASVSAVWPTHLTNDIGLVVIETSGNSANLTPPAGWVALPGTPVTDVATTAGSKLHVWWKRAASAAEAAVATGAGTDHVLARLYTFRGCVTTGNPWNVITTGTKTTASTTATVPALTTTLDDLLITMIVGRPDDNASTTHFGVPVNANLTGLAERGEAGTASGNGGGFVLSTGVKALPGATGTSTLTKTVSTTDTYVVLALKGPTSLIHTVGTFALAGTTTGLLKSSTIHGTTQTYSLVGNDADFSKSVSLDISAGTFTLAGTTTGLLFSGNLIQQTGAFLVAGNNAILARTVALDVTKGTFTLAGTITGLIKANRIDSSVGKFFLPERNLLRRSEEFNDANWNKTNVTATVDQITAPDGSASADLIAGNSGTALKYIVQPVSLSTAGTFTFSVFAKPGTESLIVVRINDQTGTNEVRQRFNLSLGTLVGSVAVAGTATSGTSSISASSNGWYKCVVTATFAAFTEIQGNVWLNNYSSVSVTTNFYLWGAQLEQSSVVGDYDPTGAVRASTTVLDFQRAIVGQTSTFVLAGSNLFLSPSRSLDVTTGTYSLFGNTLGLIRTLALHSVPGSFSVSGKDAVFSLTRSFNLTTGTYNVSGNNVGVNRFYQLNSQPGTYQVVGSGLDYFSNRNLVTLPLDIVTDFRSVGNFFWYQTTQTIQPVKYKITKRNEFILGRQTNMGRRGL